MKNDSPLPPQQEAFVQAYRKNGRNQRQAYLEAYPKSQKWKNPNSVDCEASKLMSNTKVLQRLKALDQAEGNVRDARFDFIDTTLREFIEKGMSGLSEVVIRPADIVSALGLLAKMHGVDSPRDEDE